MGVAINQTVMFNLQPSRLGCFGIPEVPSSFRENQVTYLSSETKNTSQEWVPLPWEALLGEESEGKPH